MLAKLHVSFNTKISLLPWEGQVWIAGRVCKDTFMHIFPATINALWKGQVHGFTAHAR